MGGSMAVVYDLNAGNKESKDQAELNLLYLVGKVAVSMAHEIRNPICSARGFLELAGLKDEGDSDGNWYRFYMPEVIEQLDRVNMMIRQFLSLNMERPVKKIPQNINHLVERLLPQLHSGAAVLSITVKTDLQPVPDLLLDGQEITQLITNLTRNGLEAMSPGGYLTIRTYKDGPAVVLALEDTGTGISTEDLDKLRKPFFTTKELGLGLGLPACYCIARRHDAVITADTGAGGTTFYVKFRM
jgi:signal transduction histidine kinase